MVPIKMPPSRLTATMISPAIASPLTNFMAPSMAPYSWLSFSTRARRLLASSMSIVAARRSASMDICLPGMASSEKRAATSATRSAPLVMTTNCTMVRIRNTTRPTIRLPPTTKLPNVSMMWPASPCSRISRVVAMEMPSRNRVVTSSTEGKDEKDSGEGRYMATISRMADSVMLVPISTSTSEVGSGRIIMKMIETIRTARTMSLRLVRILTARLSACCMEAGSAGIGGWGLAGTQVHVGPHRGFGLGLAPQGNQRLGADQVECAGQPPLERHAVQSAQGGLGLAGAQLRQGQRDVLARARQPQFVERGQQHGGFFGPVVFQVDVGQQIQQRGAVCAQRVGCFRSGL